MGPETLKKQSGCCFPPTEGRIKEGSVSLVNRWEDLILFQQEWSTVWITL